MLKKKLIKNLETIEIAYDNEISIDYSDEDLIFYNKYLNDFGNSKKLYSLLETIITFGGIALVSILFSFVVILISINYSIAFSFLITIVPTILTILALIIFPEVIFNGLKNIGKMFSLRNINKLKSIYKFKNTDINYHYFLKKSIVNMLENNNIPINNDILNKLIKKEDYPAKKTLLSMLKNKFNNDSEKIYNEYKLICRYLKN